MSYNTQKEKLALNELSSMCTYEEQLRKEKGERVHMVSHGPLKKRHFQKKCLTNDFKFKKRFVKQDENSQEKKNDYKRVMKCFYCKKKNHFKKNCKKFLSHNKKKGSSMACVCFENNLIDVPNNTWWIDTGATSHISNSMQCFFNKEETK